jgi:hypothetical protein
MRKVGFDGDVVSIEPQGGIDLVAYSPHVPCSTSNNCSRKSTWLNSIRAVCLERLEQHRS